jgi:hypothetical protein
VDIHGNESPFALLTPNGTTVGGSAPQLTTMALSAPWPNPARERTMLSFALPAAQTVSVALYGIDGRRVRVLAAGRHESGTHLLTVDARDGRGRPLASGTYFVRLVAGERVRSRRLILVR